MKILGVSRSNIFSPNSEARDAAIFNKVAALLHQCGHSITICSEDVCPSTTDARLVFSMARSQKALQTLSQWEQEGVVVINSACAILRNDRLFLAKLFAENRVGAPAFKKVNLSDLSAPFPGQAFWVKRADACAQEKSDVVYCPDEATWIQARTRFLSRGISQLIAVEHLQGDLIKFYGVIDQPFFYYYYPTATRTFSKFGLEEVNGAPQYLTFSPDVLHELANRTSHLTGFSVYGGDAVVCTDGSIKIIDFNDWPSFSACLEDASKAIFSHLIKELNKNI
ncbi:MAG: hypothetical protein IJ816_00180 [Alloprevotella sp.]|nr:hypothetical protein [Alloprevotella sp.]